MMVASGNQPLLEVVDLCVEYALRRAHPFAPRRTLRAVDGVDFTLLAGETLGIVGESGCGKSSLMRAVLRLVVPARGTIRFRGEDLARLDERALRARRRFFQPVFQDPLAALDPRLTALEQVAEALEVLAPQMPARERLERARAMLARVGLGAALGERYPHQLSGGQCQRVGIARALVAEPALLVCDEPVSALDVSVRAQIVNLLAELQSERGLALLFIAHDLAVVRHVSHRVLVMYLGRAVELAAAEALYARPRHPYTRALIAAVPVPERRLVPPVRGEPPSPLAPPAGCAYHPRCPYAVERCRLERPLLRPVGDALVACHRAEEI